MTNPENDPYRNQLLRRLNPGDLGLLQPHLELCDLEPRMTLEKADSEIETVYFLEEGIASVVATASGKEAEVGLVGFEGMTGAALVMGADYAAHQCYVQSAGSAFRMGTEPLKEALADSPTLRLFLLRYVHYFHIQTSYTALINAKSNLEERLARWLLMCDDRVHGERLAITHEFLAVMLGARRPGVTVGLQVLEGRGFIYSRRGEVHIRDRSGLAACANGTYGKPEADYVRLVGL
ncbi:Crp/Fnr family transcriptional regulator [Mesorhizobium sp. XAP10]|uniref:Crp/Fnr family transcriptional regulator n=1 Tax=unclassified Mesorhizobium TaxID=325217 RepID=UPI0023DF97A6|nr:MULTISPECIES: Crp/Fnr family transcriptional regulator [unclassified Mesorhizobium]MDF3151600.1 Crp/Fnr family transcriptional regulator [Mesorhizobium sp. XAP10]MDF3244486.1 Crp/Fnr family transcriptional regulator [Mesorhizobium sp. XAP4]